MKFESGPLSKILDDKRVRDAAEPYVRLRVRVPEAYLLLGPYATTRPGMLVLDADGRRVDSFSLGSLQAGADADPGKLAEWLAAAVKKAPTEHFVLNGGAKLLNALAKQLGDIKGVLPNPVLRGDELTVRAAVGALSPESIQAQIKEDGSEIAIVQPVPVRVDDADGQRVHPAGVWFPPSKARTHTWMTRLLLHPQVFGQRATDLVAEEFTFEKLPKGGTACAVAQAPLTVKGVLTVVPKIFRDAVIVIGRKGDFDRSGVAVSFTNAGHEPKPASEK